MSATNDKFKEMQSRIDALHHALGQLLQVQDGLPMTGIEATRRLDQARAVFCSSAKER